MATFNTLDLEAYLDEALPPEQMADVEHALREDKQLTRRLAAINARRDHGVHSLGEIWRRERLSCPGREQLGSYLLEALPDDIQQFVTFHLEIICCRVCVANLADLQAAQQAAAGSEVESRRRKYFQSSAGLLRK